MSTLVYTYDDVMILSMRLNRNLYKIENDVMRNFNVVRKAVDLPVHEVIKKTVLQKSDAAQVIKVLNKMSEKNYEKLKVELFEMLETMNDPDELEKITRTLFLIASTNMFYSILFSKLYVELIPIKREFYNLFQDYFDLYLSDFEKIEYVGPNTNYDLYCEYTKKVDQMKSMLMFFVNLMKQNVCKLENVIGMCMVFAKKCLATLPDASKRELAEELINCVFLVIKECGDLMVFHGDFEVILGLVDNIRKHPEVNSKIKFKCMDIVEYAKKL